MVACLSSHPILQGPLVPSTTYARVLKSSSDGRYHLVHVVQGRRPIPSAIRVDACVNRIFPLRQIRDTTFTARCYYHDRNEQNSSLFLEVCKEGNLTEIKGLLEIYGKSLLKIKDTLGKRPFKSCNDMD